MAPAIPTIDLHTPDGGIPVPLLGFGTWQLLGEQGYRAVSHALAVGYRHLDTATAYGNEDVVGRAVADSGLARDEVFVTTKMPPDAAGRERETLERSLRQLGMDHVDLWLVHWPPDGRARPETWRAFQAARDEGLTRAIGVSNYSLAQIDELVEATGEAPAVNQVPFSPWDYDASLVAGHAARGVALEGYSPFKRSDVDEPVLGRIAAAHGVSVRQVILLWHLRHRVMVIPKASRPERIEENVALDFALSDEEVAEIDGLAARR
ncbi:MAG: aldo/keto reductase [Actinomycetales bacterium]|nr:aldo/keto reductase [Actinomycetales bacterium]